jgi:hypothetical protein
MIKVINAEERKMYPKLSVLTSDTNDVVAIMEGGDPTVITTAEGYACCHQWSGQQNENDWLVKRPNVRLSSKALCIRSSVSGRRFDEVDTELVVSYQVIGDLLVMP